MSHQKIKAEKTNLFGNNSKGFIEFYRIKSNNPWYILQVASINRKSSILNNHGWQAGIKIKY